MSLKSHPTKPTKTIYIHTYENGTARIEYLNTHNWTTNKHHIITKKTKKEKQKKKQIKLSYFIIRKLKYSNYDHIFFIFPSQSREKKHFFFVCVCVCVCVWTIELLSLVLL